jgi:type II secretory pathway pseudopilin PulG
MTLIEILIALSLTGFLMTAAMALAYTMVQTHNDQSEIEVITENLRGGMAKLTRDVRLAGAGMSSGVATNAATGTPAVVPAVAIVNSNPDSIDLLLAAGPTPSTTLAPVLPTDVQIIVDGTSGGQFASGQYALLSDFTNAVLYKLGSPSAGTVGAVPGIVLPMTPPAAFPVTSFGAGSIVLQASSVRYEVLQGDGVSLPNSSFLMALTGAPIGLAGESPLAENVIDFEIAVGIDGLNGFPLDGVLQQVGRAPNDDEWVFDVPGETLPPPPFTVQALRITLVGRTTLPGSQKGPGRPAVEDHAAGPPDNYRWRVLSETVMLRNLVLR